MAAQTVHAPSNMAAQTVYLMGMGMFSPTVEDDSHGMTELPRNELPAPQLVMLANVAVTSESNGCDNMAEEKQMMELKTVGSNCYSDSEDESVRYSYENHREICIIDYPESPQPAENHSDIRIINYPESPVAAVAQAEKSVDEIEEDDDKEEEVLEDLSKPANPEPPSPTPLSQRKGDQATGVTRSAKKKKPFHCKACNYQAMCEKDFVLHIRIHTANKMAVVRRVEGTDTVKANKEVPAVEFEPTVDAGDIKGVIRCERCGYNTNRYDHYIAHLKHHSKEGDNHRVYKCVICTYTTVSQYHWRKHLRNHFPSKLFTCSSCCYFSDRKNNYVQHIRTHTGERPFQCSQCEYSSSQKTHLTRHMRTHSGERPFKCESCNYLAANQHEVTRHARQVHNGPKPLSCPYCQYKTADRSNFKKHVELHLNPRQFLCPVCKYAASKKCNLQYHIKSRHPGCVVVNMDVSKVKLRAKKLESETDEFEKAGLSGMEDDQDMEEETQESFDAEKQPGPINLSTKSNKNAEAGKSGTYNKTQKKCELTPNKETLRKAKDKVEKKVTPKQKTEKGSENTKTKQKIKQNLTKIVATVEGTEDDIKKSHKRQKLDKPSVQGMMELKETKEKGKKTSLKMDTAADGTDDKTIPGKSEKRGRSKRSEIAVKMVIEPREKIPVKNLGTKGKATKRKAAEALDLSTKASPEEPCTNKTKRLKVATDKQQSKPSNPQRVTKNTESDPVLMEEGHANEMVELPAVIKLKKTKKTNKKETVVTCETPSPEIQQSLNQKTILTLDAEECATNQQLQEEAPKQLNLTEQEGHKPVNLTRQKASKQVNLNEQKATEQKASKKVNLNEQKASKEVNLTEQKACKEVNLTEQKASKKVNLNEQKAPEEVNLNEQKASKEVSLNEQKATEQVHLTEQEAHKQLSPAKQESTTAKETPSVPEKVELSGETTGITSSCGDKTPSLTEGSSPTIRRPQVEPTSPSLELPGPQGKPTDTEDDEGIHSHDGGSDISDSASEGSDDSGLNGAGKTADPETPTEEIPTPTELKSHTCIFCDRTFLLEAEYRRHLNRHLVNVYYLDSESKADQ